MKEFLKNRSVGFFIGLAAAILMIFGDILFIALDMSDRTFSFVTFAFVLLGAVAEIASVFLPKKVSSAMPIVVCACYGVALGQHLILALETFSDIWNEVTFVGGNAVVTSVFLAVFAVGTIASIISAFLKGTENNK